jgi:hypothetical protein
MRNLRFELGNLCQDVRCPVHILMQAGIEESRPITALARIIFTNQKIDKPKRKVRERMRHSVLYVFFEQPESQ